MKHFRSMGVIFLVTTLLLACNGPSNQNQNNGTGAQKGQDSQQTTQNSSAEKAAQKPAMDTSNPGKPPKKTGKSIKSGEAVKAPSIKDQQKTTQENLQSRSTSPADKSSQKGSDSLTFILQGIVKGGARSEVILDKVGIAGDTKALASTIVNQQDRFKFGGKIPRPGLYQLRFPSDRIIVVLKGGVQRIKTNFSNLDHYEAEGPGSKGTMYMLESFKLLNKYNQKGDSLRRVAENTENNSKRIRLYEKIQKKEKKWDKAKLKEMKALLKRVWEDESIAAPAIAVRAQVHKDMDFFERLYKDYKEKYPENYFVQKLGEKLENAREALKRHQ